MLLVATKKVSQNISLYYIGDSRQINSRTKCPVYPPQSIRKPSSCGTALSMTGYAGHAVPTWI